MYKLTLSPQYKASTELSWPPKRLAFNIAKLLQEDIHVCVYICMFQNLHEVMIHKHIYTYIYMYTTYQKRESIVHLASN